MCHITTLSVAKSTGVLISPYPDQEGNKLQRQKILSFIYPIYNHNWRNIVCFLFSWRYNPLWLYFHSPIAGFSLLVIEVS